MYLGIATIEKAVVTAMYWLYLVIVLVVLFSLFGGSTATAKPVDYATKKIDVENGDANQIDNASVKSALLQ